MAERRKGGIPRTVRCSVLQLAARPLRCGFLEKSRPQGQRCWRTLAVQCDCYLPLTPSSAVTVVAALVLVSYGPIVLKRILCSRVYIAAQSHLSIQSVNSPSRVPRKFYSRSPLHFDLPPGTYKTSPTPQNPLTEPAVVLSEGLQGNFPLFFLILLHPPPPSL